MRDPASTGSVYQPLGRYGASRSEWILSAALGAASLASSIWGASKSAKAAKESEAALAREKADNAAWYRRRYNEDYIDTAAGQNMLRIARDAARENWQKASGAAAVAGGTDAATAMAKESGNKMVGNAIANIAANDTARKDNVDAAYRAENARLSQEQRQVQREKAAAISQAAGAASDAFMSGAVLSASGAFGNAGKLSSMGTNMVDVSKNYELLSGIDKSKYPYLFGNAINFNR